mgnify:CR=1 FL=1
MNLFIDKHQELLLHFLEKEVDFIVIGGYSVIYHGYRRTTGDVDLWLKPDNRNKVKVMAALKSLDFESEELKLIDQLDFTMHLAFSIWDEPEKVDFLTYINLISYGEADQMKIIAEVDNLKIPFLHLNHLLLSKKNTGHPQDIADIEQLQKINKFRN